MEILVLGLVMICAQESASASTCPLFTEQGEEGAYFLLVNATQLGPGCSNRGCTTCGGNTVGLHEPVLVFYDASANPQGQSCETFAAKEVPPEVRCLRLLASDLCVDLPDMDLTIPYLTRRHSEKPGSDAEEKYFNWVAPVSLFDTGTKTFKPMRPGAFEPAIARLRIPNRGELQALLIGHGMDGGNKNYTLWGSGRAAKQALAEGVVWTTSTASDVRLTDCAGKTVVTISQGHSRVAVVNLPETIFDKPSRGSTYSKDHLDHFELFYNLFNENVCGRPERQGGFPSQLWSYALAKWIREGGTFSPLELEQDREDSSTALCPPSKYP